MNKNGDKSHNRTAEISIIFYSFSNIKMETKQPNIQEISEAKSVNGRPEWHEENEEQKLQQQKFKDKYGEEAHFFAMVQRREEARHKTIHHNGWSDHNFKGDKVKGFKGNEQDDNCKIC